MKTIRILDCTLRDGGYCNQWMFGEQNIKQILQHLSDAMIDIIECGYISRDGYNDNHSTLFSDVESMSKNVPRNNDNSEFVAMMNFGECDLESIAQVDANENVISGVRVAFHKADWREAIEFCHKLQGKGYKIFVQPMISMNYTDAEFIELLSAVNELKPYAFYIVDSFGMMKQNDLLHYVHLIENNLNIDITLGLHSHNNMQLAYSNAQLFVSSITNRDVIIDTSIMGMGRGAGNLNTELFVEYLNDFYHKHYLLKPLLIAIDEIITKFYSVKAWGYSLSNYLSAKHNTHPNYAAYLDDKKTLTLDNMNDIFKEMDDEKRVSFDKKYIEDLYHAYMENTEMQERGTMQIRQHLKNKNVLVIGPGRTSIEELDKISACYKHEDVVVISINAEYKMIPTDYIFVSNLRRFRELDLCYLDKMIVSSNIRTNQLVNIVSYKELTNDIESVQDNACLMLIKLLIDSQCKQVFLAGIDGYSQDLRENYASMDHTMVVQTANLNAINKGMEKVLKQYAEKIHICFVTTPKFIKL